MRLQYHEAVVPTWSVTLVNAVWKDLAQHNYEVCVAQSAKSKYLSFWMQDQKARRTTQFLLALPTGDSEVNLPLKLLYKGGAKPLRLKSLSKEDNSEKKLSTEGRNEQRIGLCKS